jgi:cytochrome c-type biogenesis protein CcmF
VPWLIAALWGGQDGSLLWWLFLTSVFSGSCVWWLKGRYRELQPYIIATFMTVLMFVAVLMLFAANPFRTLVSGAPPDGQGLNFQLRNIYMIIHPPSLYIGFTSCVVPFGFAIAALITGRLDNEWIIASRKWMLFSWLFLTIGNALGMGWAYEELGWGGYWAWDPVENAAFLPWLTASAYVHSVMIQERRGMLKLWNIILICLTFFLTYFGTFLTRSGLIASVHSFAQSGIGTYFLWFMGLIILVCATLISYRFIEGHLKSRGNVESLLSRELTFLLNNWILLIIMFFIAGATVWPRISEWLFNEEATVSPPYYNLILPPLALLLIFLMGTAPLLGWRKTSKELLFKSFRWPLGMMALAVTLHFVVGPRIGFPPFVEADRIYGGTWGNTLTWLQGKLPVVTFGLVAYNITVVVQEFQRGVAARMKGKSDEGPVTALVQLLSKSRRRYGGYIVHVGIAVMFLGFAGKSWESKKEITMVPGQSTELEEYRVTFRGPKMEVDHEKRMVFAEVDLERHGKPVGLLRPAQFIYKDAGMQMSSEIATYHTLSNDFYVSIGTVDATTKRASFRFYVNPLINFVPFGQLILILGCVLAMWPEMSFQEAGAFGYVRALASVASMVMLSVLLALAPSLAHAQQQDMARGGIVEQTDQERALFRQMLCDCGSCPKEALETCTCPWAHSAREQIREELAKGKTPDEIREKYALEHGADTVIVQAASGKEAALWVVPSVLAFGGAGLVWYLTRKWRQNSVDDSVDNKAARKRDKVDSRKKDEYDDKLDAELRDLE